MATTNNGWPKDPAVVRLYVGADSDGTEVAVGSVAAIFNDFLTRYHNEVEPLRKCNGYRSSAYNASLPGSVSSSNHVSGTAVDNNGDVHPNEAAHGHISMASGFTPAGLAKLRALLALFPVIKWGGDFARGYRDYMHFEITGSAEQINEFAKRYITVVPPPVNVGDEMPSLVCIQQTGTGKSAVYNETIGWVDTSAPGVLAYYVAIANNLGFKVTNVSVDANGWIMAQSFKFPGTLPPFPSPTVVDVAVLAKALAPLINAGITIDGAELAAIAKAVNDDAAKRLVS